MSYSAEQNSIEKFFFLQDAFFILEQALASVKNGIIITDPHQSDNPIIYVNPGFEEITGYSAQELLGRNGRFLQGNDRDQPVLTDMRQAIQEGRPFWGVIRNYRKNGELFWNEMYISPVRNEAGQVINYMGISNDVTERVAMESELKETSHLLTTIIENIPNIIFMKDLQTNTYTMLNRAFEDWTGYSREQFLGKSDYEMFSPEYADQVIQSDYEAIEHKTLVELRAVSQNWKAKRGAGIPY
jgi:PAS domain S-box-containing protein